MFGSTHCVKCNGSTFRAQEISAHEANYKLVAIQCSSCGVAFGVTEYFDSGALLKQQEAKIVALTQKLSNVENAVNQIACMVQSMRR